MKYLDMAIIGVLFIGGLAFRSLSTDGNALNKGVYYDNVEYTDNVTFNSVDGTNIDYSAKLDKLGEYYELKFDVVNSTRYDIEIADYIYNKDDQYIKYELCYEDGNEINNGDIIKAGESKGLKFKVSYVNPVLENNYIFDTSFSIQYEQAI